MIGIITAIEEEFSALNKLVENKSNEEIASMPFVKGTVEGKDVAIGMSGQGKVHAACCTQILIDRFGADTIFNVGIAGGLNDSLEIGEIVLSDKTAQYDFDAVGEGFEMGQIPGIESVYFKAEPELIEAGREAADELGINYQVGGILTADLFLDDERVKTVIKKKFDGIACEMEGAAVAQVCYLNDLPFLIIRSISDSADENSDELSVKNAQFASDKTIDLVKNLIKKL